MFESWYASRPTPESALLLDRMREARRDEARAGAERLIAVGELLMLRCRESGERPDWAADTWEAVAAQVAAALQCSVAMGHSYLRYAMAMRDRLPQVGKAFAAGDIDYRAFQTIVFRTDLITDAEVLAKVDAQVAVLVSRRPSLTRGGLGAAVDRVVALVDADAVRRAAEAATDRFVDVRANESGMAWVSGNVLGADGQALDKRLDELAGPLCEGAHGPGRSGVPMRWARSPPVRSDWYAAAVLPAARPRRGLRATWSFMWLPTAPPSKAAGRRRACYLARRVWSRLR